MTGHDVTYHDGAFLAVSLVEVDHFLERKIANDIGVEDEERLV